MNILFDPPPTGRVGVIRGTEKVIVGRDYSSVAFMMEEYIAFGATKLIVPKSSLPEYLISDMNEFLVRKIQVLDDYHDIVNAGRLLHSFRNEIEANYNENTGKVQYKENTPLNIKEMTSHCHDIIRRISFGFNNKIQVEMLPSKSIVILRKLRELSSDSKQRLILSELEAVFNGYEKICFDGVKPITNIPKDLLNNFDRLINDASYVQYSEAITHLNPRGHGLRALSDIRRYGRSLKENKTAELLWQSVQILISLYNGLPLPNFQTLQIYFEGREFPLLANMQEARQRAINNWALRCPDTVTLSSKTSTTLNEDIVWLPPSTSTIADYVAGSRVSLGLASDMIKILEGFLAKKSIN